jgi:hypothetical protein
MAIVPLSGTIQALGLVLKMSENTGKFKFDTQITTFVRPGKSCIASVTGKSIHGKSQ